MTTTSDRATRAAKRIKSYLDYARIENDGVAGIIHEEHADLYAVVDLVRNGQATKAMLLARKLDATG